MCRFLLLLLTPILTTFAIYASVDVPPALIKNYTIADYKASGQNWDLTISPGGILYVANNSGLLTFDGNMWTTYSLPDESIVYSVVLSNDTVFTQGETSIGYWLPDGMGRLIYYPLEQSPEHITFKDHSPEPPFPLSEEILQQKPSAFVSIDQFNFVGTLANGIYVADKDGNSLLHISIRVGLQDNIVHDLCVEKEGHIWAAFDNGISKIIFNSPLRLLATRSRVGKLEDIVMEDGMMYIKTNTNYYKRNLNTGVYAHPVSEEEALPYFNKEEEKETETITEVLAGNRHFMKLLESDNIYPVSDSLYWFVKGDEAILISQENDIVTLKCRILFSNYNLNLIYRGEQIFPINDTLHIASTMQGIVLINSNSVINNIQKKGVPFRFTCIEYKDPKGIHALDPDSEKISLPYNYHEITICVGSSVYNLNNQISYRIDGISSDWSEWQKEGSIDLLQLPNGEYKLLVRRYSPIGDFPTISMQLEVRPPWYKTIWAIAIYVFIFWVLLYIGIRRHFLKQRDKEKQLREIERREEQRKMQQLKNEMLEAELQNKKNELMIQTSSLVEKGLVTSKLLEELEHQKDILGDQYPDKLYKRMHSLMEEKLTNQNDWLAFESYFNSAHQDFIDRFRQTYKDITNADLRLCCLLRMNLSTKEIASILNISIRGVELRRYRLRKRIGLDSDTNLTEFLMNF